MITGLVTEWFERAYEDVMLFDTRFQGAEKYKVAEDSFYVEAKYIIVVSISGLTRPFNSVWLSGNTAVPNEFTFNALSDSLQFNNLHVSSIQGAPFCQNRPRNPHFWLLHTFDHQNEL